MRKIKTLALLMIAACAIAFAQEKKEVTETKVTKLEAGATLNKTDVGFLSLVSGASKDKKRGAGDVAEATIGKTKFSEGHKLTKEDVEVINKATKAYSDANKDIVTDDKKEPTAGKSRGCYYGYCYYWYYDYYYGRYRKYWYCC